VSAHCAAERRPQGTIRQRRIFGIGDASPRCRRRLGCASRAQARGGSLLHHVPNRPPRFPTSTPPPGPSAHPSGFSIRSQRDYFGFNPTAFKAPVRTSVATEFNPGEHEYDTIPARHSSWNLPIFWHGSIGGRKKRGNRPPFFGRIPTCNTNKTRRLPRRE